MNARRRHIARFLCCISLLVLAVAVFPHHHHSEQLCLKNDLTENADGGCGHASGCCCDGHCCCNTGCLASHFHPQRPCVTQVPQPHHQDLGLSHACSSLLALASLLYLPANKHTPHITYIESLHNTHFTRAKGLRAPPCVLC